MTFYDGTGHKNFYYIERFEPITETMYPSQTFVVAAFISHSVYLINTYVHLPSLKIPSIIFTNVSKAQKSQTFVTVVWQVEEAALWNHGYESDYSRHMNVYCQGQ